MFATKFRLLTNHQKGSNVRRVRWMRDKLSLQLLQLTQRSLAVCGLVLLLRNKTLLLSIKDDRFLNIFLITFGQVMAIICCLNQFQQFINPSKITVITSCLVSFLAFLQIPTIDVCKQDYYTETSNATRLPSATSLPLKIYGALILLASKPYLSPLGVFKQFWK